MSRLTLVLICVSVLAFCIKTGEAEKDTSTYDVTIKKICKDYRQWAGVILSSRFVLSYDKNQGDYDQYDPSQYAIHIGYVPPKHIRGAFFEAHIRNVKKFWILDNELLLIKMDREIKFNEGVNRIHLPKGADLVAWKNPCAILHRKELMTMYWCEKEGSFTINKFKISADPSQCEKGTCKYKQGLIPNCISVKKTNLTCYLEVGAPLVYNDILVGIRRYRQRINYNDKKTSDKFINIAPYAEAIEKLISNKLQCHGYNSWWKTRWEKGIEQNKVIDIFHKHDAHKIFQRSNLQNSPKYDVLIKRYTAPTKMWFKWAGVLLNEKFVLSVDPFDGKQEILSKDLRVVTDYIQVQISDKMKHFRNNENDIKVLKNWIFESLLLIRLQVEVGWDDKVKPISLPDGYNLETWKSPMSIPENKEFVTSYWCREKFSPTFELQISTIERKCSKKSCFYENGLVPICMKIKTNDKICDIPAGAPIVYNNSLVGLRKYTLNLNPFSETSGDYFINIAQYRDMILRLQEGYVKCRV